MKEEIKEEKKIEQSAGKKLIAKKDFRFSDGKTIYEIKKGDEVKVPKVFIQNLKTEKVI